VGRARLGSRIRHPGQFGYKALPECNYGRDSWSRGDSALSRTRVSGENIEASGLVWRQKRDTCDRRHVTVA